MSDTKERAEEERERLTSILDGVKLRRSRRQALQTVIENVAWMKVKLDDARELVADSNVAIPYDNGGGQTGIRENPVIRGYESLWKSYMSGLSQVLAVLPEESAAEAEAADRPATVLQLVQAKHRREEA